MKRLFSVFLTVFLLMGILPLKTDASAPYQDAEAFVVINAATNNVLEGKDIHKRLPMASTTKIMTAIVMCEMVVDMQKTIVTTNEMVTVEGSSMGLLPGDTVSYHDLLYGLLLASGNDAANTVAISLCGSTDAFVEHMNRKASELGLENTHFETPSGLDGANHFTSAYDLSLIASYALKIPQIAKAVATQKVTLCYGNPPYRRSITNHNKLIGSYDGVIGVKTGFTKKSGRCLVSAVKRGDSTLIVVTLNTANDYDNHKFLVESNLKKLDSVTLTPTEIPKLSLADGREIRLISESVNVGLQIEERNEIKYEINLPSFVYAPITQGAKLGWADIFYKDKKIASVDILSAQSIDDITLDINTQTKIFDIFIGMFKL